MVYVITYDLLSRNKDYASLYQAIQNLGEVIHPLESVWIVDTHVRNLNADHIIPLLRAHMSEDDLLFVVRIDGEDRNGWMAKTAWSWIRTHENPSPSP